LIRLDKGRIWLANDTSDAHVALSWAKVGRGLFFFFWELGPLPLSIGNHLGVVFTEFIVYVVLRFWWVTAFVVISSESYHLFLEESV
jgi:hypothetical protein